MKYEITYRNQRTLEEYTLAGVDANNYNEAVKIAKQYKGEGEEIASIQLDAAGFFADLLAAVQNINTGRAK